MDALTNTRQGYAYMEGCNDGVKTTGRPIHPFVNMISVKLLLVIAKIHGLESRLIDLVLAFPKANLDKDI
jgi:hypothetical protein